MLQSASSWFVVGSINFDRGGDRFSKCLYLTLGSKKVHVAVSRDTRTLEHVIVHNRPFLALSDDTSM